MFKNKQLLTATLFAIAGLFLAAAPSPAQATEFSQAELFFELNDTDGDLGIHAAIDGDAYKRLEIEDPRERRILLLQASGRLASQGLTQLFFESAEPSFDELDPQKFFRRFPEGKYEIEAITLDGREVEAEVMLSHVLAAPVDNITVNNIPAAEDCDAPLLPSVSQPIIIDWNPVKTSHPEIGKTGAVTIVRYQFFVEQGDVKFAVDLPPTQTRFRVPAEVIALGNANEPFKFEIIARTASGNNTAIENCFTLR